MAKETNEPQDRTFSRAEITAGVQAAFEICATCAHERGSHGEDERCGKVWMEGAGRKKRVHCLCEEYWPERREHEDRMLIAARKVSFGGSVDLVLDRRIPSEFWDELTQGRDLTVLLRVSVSGKSFKRRVVTLTETRRLEVADLYFLQESTLAGKDIRDAKGRRVDPETGEIS